MKEIITDNARLDPSVFREGNPWRVVVDLNEACNLKCSYCHIDALFWQRCTRFSHSSTQFSRFFTADADQMRAFDVTLTGGEIIIMPNLIDYLESVNKLGFTSVQIITNGTLLSEGLSRELKDAGIGRISISIDGLEGEVTDLFGNDQRYDQSLKGAIFSNGLIYKEIVGIARLYKL